MVTLEKHTALRLNWVLLKDPPRIWNEETIRKRSGELAKLVTEVWPFANGI